MDFNFQLKISERVSLAIVVAATAFILYSMTERLRG